MFIVRIRFWATKRYTTSLQTYTTTFQNIDLISESIGQSGRGRTLRLVGPPLQNKKHDYGENIESKNLKPSLQFVENKFRNIVIDSVKFEKISGRGEATLRTWYPDNKFIQKCLKRPKYNLSFPCPVLLRIIAVRDDIQFSSLPKKKSSDIGLNIFDSSTFFRVLIILLGSTAPSKSPLNTVTIVTKHYPKLWSFWIFLLPTMNILNEYFTTLYHL